MEPVIDTVVGCSSFMVPVMALWAIVALYLQRDDCECITTQLLYFGTLLLIAFITVRTMATNDGCWLIHTATLGITIVAGAMRRPTGAPQHFVPDLTH
ncbi:MAG: hypothetical protein R3C09_17550 [Pirellulaceae bacterium]|jgi:hypothetical protein